ncbi:amino acid adenylation domain-containing protein, partial [Rheinheimera pacifica]|uniref:non-ribosomal peptide synthetase n=1 Tax=Rheinheimera pacifica TaxID=173990 RepID=UPI0028560EB8
MIEHKTTNNLTDYFQNASLINPNKAAVVSSLDNTRMSYRQLDERSNQVAHFLIAKGVVAGSVIAVELKRSADALCLLLGIIKAGCAYAPIDVTYPQQRKNYMVNAARAVMLIKQRVEDGADPKALEFATVIAASANLSTAPCARRRSPQSVAYVMFTSGSTGTPKAVQIQDEAIVRLFQQGNALQILPNDTVLLHSALVFDASTYEIWGAWLAGATLVVARNEPLSIRFLAEHISDFDISVLWLTAPLVPLLADQNIELVKSLRLLVAGGDALPAESVQRISGYCPGLQFVNGYGPTEATTFSCYFAISSDTIKQSENGSVPIGYPLDGTSCYVLDETLKPVQDGELGELYIGGLGVGHGYLNDSAKTATQFIPNPFAGYGTRLYKTGDLVKRATGGELLFFGRCDQQIKVRGYRIELGEIDAALCGLSPVEQSVTLVVERSPGQKQIIAFVVTSADTSVSQLKAALNDVLPDYMLPNQLVAVAALPLNVNGKVDRQALLNLVEHTSETVVDESKDDFSLVISDLFQQVLGVTDIDPEVSFFDLGGDSISAIQISGLAEQGGIALTVSHIFELKTVRAIAGALAKQHARPDSHSEHLNPLLALWAEVLEQPNIKPDDNFFELGGDSILAIQLAGLAEQRGLRCSVSDIFNYKTVVELVNSCALTPPDALPAEDDSMLQLPELPWPQGVEVAYPASQVQIGMLIQSDVGRAAATYHDILSHKIRLPFCQQTFNTAMRALTEKHEILRTAFDLANYAVPMQLVHRQITLDYEVIDLLRLDEVEQKKQFATVLEQEKRLGFCWDQPGLLRAKVLLLQPDSFVLTLSFHHAIMDGWSTTVLLGDFVDLYAGNITAQQLNERQVTPYHNFIEAEQRAIADPGISDFWSDYLQDAEMTVLPNFSAKQGAKGVCQRKINITALQTAQLKAIATQLQVSLKHVLLAVHMRAVSMLSGSSQVLSGLVCHGRPEVVGAERTVGLFINTVPFRGEIQAECWFEFIQRIFANEISLIPHRRYPLANILRDHGSSSLFDFAFNFTHFREYSKRHKDNEALLQRGAFETDAVFGAVDFEHSNFGLAVQAGLAADGHCAYLVLDADNSKYPTAAVNLIEQAYETCLAHLLATPEANISAIHLPATQLAAQQQVGNAVQDFDILSRFAQLVGQFPQQTAIVSAGADISYAELDSRAQSLACYLGNQHIKRGDIVAVHARRGIDAIVALLAIWKAGACYLPIDPAYPEARKAYMQSDSGCRVVLFDQPDDDLSWCASDVIKLQINDAVIAQRHYTDTPCLAVNAAAPAYLIYTSGSTGNPKGVVVAFSGIATLLAEQARLFSVTTATPCLQFASSSFDASLFEIMMSLFNGGTLHIVSEQMRLDPQLLSTYAMANNIGVATLPASMLQTLTDYDWPAECQMVIAGEAFPAELARTWAKKAHVVNAYGPTEATIWATWHRCNEYEAGNVPIGVPIAGMEAYVLDDFGHRLPAGIAGELCLGGVALALGYHNNPRQTAERFIPNPFSAVAGSRLYRTGDKACINAQGEIEFLGRLDWQVKLRGFRIELGEIEQVIQNVPGVKNAVVILKQDSACQRQWLVCYCQLDSQVSASQIQLQVGKLLPDYMVPGEFIELEQFPLTVNGKIDRKALQNRKDLTDTMAEQAGSVEEQVLLQVWQQAFVDDAISVEDGFYSLGGDSILSIQLRALTQKQGYDFELEDLFELQTIRSLAQALKRCDAEGQAITVAPFGLIDDVTRQLLPAGCVDAYPLSRMQAGMLFHMQYNADSVRYHDVMYYLLKGSIQPDAFKQAMALSVAQHPILRTAFDISGYSQPLQLVYAEAELEFSHEDLCHLKPEQQQEYLQQWERAELGCPFSLAMPGLVRVFVHQLDSTHYRLTLSCPHAILDGWSAALLVSQWLNDYKSIISGQNTTVETPKVGFADFIALEQQAIESQSARDYWASYVDGIEKCDIAHASLRNDTGTTKRINLELARNFGHAIETLAGRLQVSIKSIFLSLHLKALALLSDHNEVTTGLICHGRPEVEGSDKVLGVFLNNVPFRLNVTEQPQWEQLIQTVYHQELKHSAHRHYPLAEIKALAGGQDLFDVAFNYTSFRPYESMSDEWLGSGGHDYSNYQFVLQAGLSAVTDQYYLFLDIDCSKVDDFYAELYRQVYLQVMENLVLSAQGAPELLALPSALMTQLMQWQGEESEVTQDVWRLFEQQASEHGGRIAVREGAQSWSYSELLSRVAHWSGVLSGEGVTAGDAVG